MSEPFNLQPTTLRELKATPLPKWAASYELQTRADGRVFLHATVNGVDVWAQPKAWASMTLSAPESKEPAGVNYGLQLGQIQARAGHLETNDPGFGRDLVAARAGRESPLPDPSASSSTGAPGVLPAAILAGGLVLAGLVARLKRRAV